MIINYSGNGFDEIIKEGITFVDFYATWCGPCMMMSPVVDEISNEVKDVKFVKVDVDNNEDLAMKYRISTIPRFMIFKDGVLVKQIVGAQQKSTLLEALKNA